MRRFFAALAVIGQAGIARSHSVTSDTIQMPPFVSFLDADSYYATLGPRVHALDREHDQTHS